MAAIIVGFRLLIFIKVCYSNNFDWL